MANLSPADAAASSAPGATPLPAPALRVVVGAGGGIGRALAQALVARGGGPVLALSRAGAAIAGALAARLDILDEPSIATAAAALPAPPALLLIATGALHGPGFAPERGLAQVEAAAMARVLAINTIGPALVVKHFAPLLPRSGRSVLAVLSARVGSIGDNRLGGWHSYRASKAALNMLVANWALELARSRPQALVVGLHPGTVDTPLSAPFQRGVPDGKLFTPKHSAEALLDALDRLGPADSGGCFDWAGARIAP